MDRRAFLGSTLICSAPALGLEAEVHGNETNNPVVAQADVTIGSTTLDAAGGGVGLEFTASGGGTRYKLGEFYQKREEGRRPWNSLMIQKSSPGESFLNICTNGHKDANGHKSAGFSVGKTPNPPDREFFSFGHRYTENDKGKVLIDAYSIDVYQPGSNNKRPIQISTRSPIEHEDPSTYTPDLTIDTDGNLKLEMGALFVKGNQVVGPRATGYTDPPFDPKTVSLRVLADFVFKLFNDLKTHGLVEAKPKP